MINVVGSSPIPVAPLPPNLPGDIPMDPTQTVQSANVDQHSASSPFQPFKKKNRFSPKMLIGGLLLLLLIIGSGVGLYLVRLNQDLRQQASVYEIDACGNYGGARCQAGTSPGDICDNNPPGSGVCITHGQRGPDGTLICSCQINEDNDDSGNTCVEQCPAGDGVLRSCSPPEADGTPQESICNVAGRIQSCGGRSYCCPAPGAQWTTDMSQCESERCTQMAGTCIGKDNVSCVSYTDGCDRADKCAEPLQQCDVDCARVGGCEEEDDNQDDEEQDDNDQDDNDNNRDNDNDDDQDTLADAGGTSPTPTPTQPPLPSELPQSGPENWMQYLQVGLGALGIGALLLLFL